MACANSYSRLIGRNHRSSSTTLRASSFLLCLVSPVLHKMLCGSFSESQGKKLKLLDVDGEIFIKALNVWCGRVDSRGMELGELEQLATMADRFQITEVVSAVEEAAMTQLRMDNCGEMLMWSRRYGLRQLKEGALKMAAERFEEFATTAGFMRMGEEALGSVVDDDWLIARNEEVVWEAVVGWMRGESGKVGWRGVVGKIRFPLMEEDYLGSRVLGMMARSGWRVWWRRRSGPRQRGGRVWPSKPSCWVGKRWWSAWGQTCGGRSTEGGMDAK